MSKYFTKEDTGMAGKYIKRYSTSLVIGEMQIKTTSTSTGKVLKEKTKNNKYWRGRGATGTLAGGDAE